MIEMHEPGNSRAQGVAKGEVAATAPVPTKYALRAAYPNPFNPTTTIGYDLPNASSVSLVVYDIQGREVMSWTDTYVPGRYRKDWNGRNKTGIPLASGIYLYRLVATPTDGSKPFVQTRKMLLLK